jgi:competence protein ComEA
MVLGASPRRGVAVRGAIGGGPTIATRIIDARPFRSVDDLDRVKGIGAKRLAELRPLVTVD